MLVSELAHNVHVDEESFRVNTVCNRVVDLAGEVQLHTVREVTTVSKLKTKDGVARLCNGVKYCSVCRCTRVRLNVGVSSTEKLLCALDGEAFCHVNKFATTVVTLAGVAFGVLVGENRTLRFEHCTRNEVLGGNHLEEVALATEFVLQYCSNLGVNLGERGVEGVI